MVVAAVTGAAAGLGMGYMLQRGQLCFHAMFGSAPGGLVLLRGWLLGVAVASVGLSVLYLTPGSRGAFTCRGRPCCRAVWPPPSLGVLGVPRLALSVLFLAAVAAVLWRWRTAESPDSRGSGGHGGWASPSGW
jgi:hypothetical protein